MSKKPSEQDDGKKAGDQPVNPSILTPIKLIQTYDDTEWEAFVLEWIEGAKPPYAHYDRLGGAGDKGRDVLAYTGLPSSDCDLDVFQCKHYDHPLMPSEVWKELGKLCLFTFRDVYRVPRRYDFVAPRGVGSTLGDLLAHPEKLRTGVIENWNSKCKDQLVANESIPLTGTLLTYVQSFDFSTVGYIPVAMLLEQHRQTKHWNQRFPQARTPRPPNTSIPPGATHPGLLYVQRLMEAYSEGQATQVADPAALKPESETYKHFKRSSEYFWSAECLNRFYREAVSEGAFDRLKEQVFDGVIETTERSHTSGLERLGATLEQAVRVQLADDDCKPHVYPRDVKGVCHHLANDDRLKWVRP